MRKLAFFPMLFACLVMCPAAVAAVQVPGTGWVWGNPQPQGNTLRAVDFEGATGVAVGDGGTIVRSADGGASWEGVASSTVEDLIDVDMPDDRTVAVGGGCAARISADGGATFRRLLFTTRESGCAARLQALSFPTSTTGFLVLSDGSVLRSTNGGRSFARRGRLPVDGPGGRLTITDLDFATPDVGVAAANAANGPASFPLFRTVDGGATWTAITALGPPQSGGPRFSSANAVRFVSDSVGFAGGAFFGGSALARTDDGGATWTPLPPSAPGAIQSIDCADASNCLFAFRTAQGAGAAAVLRTTDGGQTGTQVAAGEQPLFDVAYAGASRAIAVGELGATVASGDAGASFAPLRPPVPGLFTGVRAAGAATAYALGLSGELARSTNGGLDWSALGTAPAGRLADVSFAGDVGYAVDSRHALLRSDDGGASWAILGHQELRGRSVLALDADTVLLATPAGVRRSTDGAATFAAVPGGRGGLRALDRAGSELLAWGGRSLLRSANDGESWRALRLPRTARVISADFADARRGLVVASSGVVYATRNGGRSWRPLRSVGRDDVSSVSMGDARRAFLTLSDDALALRCAPPTAAPPGAPRCWPSAARSPRSRRSAPPAAWRCSTAATTSSRPRRAATPDGRRRSRSGRRSAGADGRPS